MMRGLLHIVRVMLFAVASSHAIELPPGFTAETLATNLNSVTALAPMPDGRVLIADQTGPLLLWKDGRILEKPALDLTGRLDTFWERGVIGLALHPQFPATPQVFVLYVAAKPFTHHVVSSFTMTGDVMDPASEKILLEGDDQEKLGGGVKAGHQGGPLRFGADGCLYIALGEQTAGEPAQQLDTLQGKILRLNPDGSVPENNPFSAQTTGKYRAIFARGVRNSYGMAVEPGTGRMFFTDVGASAFEEINELTAGANYGWPRAEGITPQTEFKQPLHAYPPVIGSCIVGGAFVPAAERPGTFPDMWRGKLLVGDFMKHWVKAFDPAAPEKLIAFAGGLNGPVALEFAADGSLLVLNRGTVWRDPKKFVANAGSLVRIRYTGESTTPEETLTGTGALDLPLAAARLPALMTRADWEARVAASARRSVKLTDCEWQPGLTVTTRVFFPSQGRISITEGTLDLPPGTVFIRDFSLADGTAIERRLHLRNSKDGWGASYRIEPSGDARLVPDGEFVELKPGRTWFYPPVENHLALPIISFTQWLPLTAAEWNRSSSDGNPSPLTECVRLGLLDNPPAQPIAPDWRDAKATPEARVRTYLHTHCAVCHQPGGPSRGQLDARLTTPLENTGLLNAAPIAGDVGIPGAKLITPGNPDKSILLRRVKDTGFFRMPPIAFHNEPTPIAQVLEQWIRSLQP